MVVQPEDSVVLDSALAEAGVSVKVRRIVQAIFASATGVVRIRQPGGGILLSEPFNIERGVLQGDIFSPVCFIAGLDRIFRHVQSTDVQCTDVQCTDVQCTDVQCTDVQCTDVQCTDVQCTDVQCTDVQCTDVQCTDVQCTDVQCTDVQCTDVQCTDVQCTDVQCTDSCPFVRVYLLL